METKISTGYRNVGRHTLPDYCTNFFENYYWKDFKEKNIKIHIELSVSNFYNGHNMTIFVFQQGHEVIKKEYSESQFFLVKKHNYIFNDEITKIVNSKMNLFFNELIVYWGL